MTDPISLRLEGGIATITINRHERRNALTIDMWEAIPTMLDKAVADKSIKLVVLKSAVDGVFCSGADLGDMAKAMTDEGFAARNLAAIKGASIAMDACPLPTVALVDGMCLGGGNALAASTDIRLASDRATFAMTPAKLGLFYPIEDTARILRLIGPARLKRLLYTADRIEARQAYDYGLVEEVFAADAFDGAVAAFFSRLTDKSLFTQWRIKEQVATLLPTDIAAEDAAFVSAQSDQDASEGMAAFKEKKSPSFTWCRP